MAATVCARTGWTHRYVWSEVDYLFLRAMFAHWSKEPPVEVLLGAVLSAFTGYSPGTSTERQTGPLKLVADGPPPGLAALRGQFPDGVMRTH